jgi:hypothetical protein
MSFQIFHFVLFFAVVCWVYIKLYQKIFEGERKKVFQVIQLSIFTGVCFILMSAFFSNNLSHLFKHETAVAWPTAIILALWLFSHPWKKKDPYAFLRSTDEPNKYGGQVKVHKTLSKVDSEKINTYPRFTVFDSNKKDTQGWGNVVIFDSSDFSVINRVFGGFRGIQQTLKTGDEFKIGDKLYVADMVSVHFLNLIDDYSSVKHTEAYEGIATPYNIQVTIEATLVPSNEEQIENASFEQA